MLTLQSVTYIHPDGDPLFSDIDCVINRNEKIALIGNNGSGKSTLLKLFAGILQPSKGTVAAESVPYYLPQVVGQFNHLTIAEALGISDKLAALNEILKGNLNDMNLGTLANDWTIEERSIEAFAHWKLDKLNLQQKMSSLSGGQKTKVFLAGIAIHQPEIVLLDEPSNHLDIVSRKILYDYIAHTDQTLVIVSHDRTLLSLLSTVYELTERGITKYGGNYEFYSEQKTIEQNALEQNLRAKEKSLRKAKEIERDSIERQQKLDARGKKKQTKAGVPTIMMKTLKNQAEKSTARLKDKHAEKVSGIANELQELRKEIPAFAKMKIDLNDSSLHNGKVLTTANAINFSYGDKLLWQKDLSFQLRSGERVALQGANGSGKTTLIKIILGELQPVKGTLEKIDLNAIYIDQDYSLINNMLTVYQQAQHFNSGMLQEHDIKTRLNRFLFSKDDWEKPCEALSGGEKMRLILCSLTISNQTPDIIILDEPTNNLDLENIGILTSAINEYQGTLLVVSHDQYFLKEIRTERTITMHHSNEAGLVSLSNC